MQLSDVGEFELIEWMKQRFNPFNAKNVEGIGDDCAIIPYKSQSSFLVTTDLLIENTHFLRDKISPEDLGHKSLAVNLSDIAAMGGTPLYAFLSIGLPPTTETSWINHLLDGIQALANQTSVLILGGDTTRAADITINWTVIGRAKNSLIKRRSQAQAGDLICCTGFLGDSAAGYRCLKENISYNELIPLIEAHNRPQPHIKEGQWLSKKLAVHAMMDLSDGIDSDLRHILQSSYCGAVIDIDQLPISPALLQASHSFQWKAEELAVMGGEDYCLLVTIDPSHYPSINQAFNKQFHRPLFVIGTITNTNQLVYLRQSQPITLESKSFNHFKI